MRRSALFIAAISIAACGGSTGPSQSASPYKISVSSSSRSGGGATARIVSLMLGVVDTGSNAPHAGAGMTLQIDVGDITAGLPPAVIDGAGKILVIGSIDTSFQHAGSVHALA